MFYILCINPNVQRIKTCGLHHSLSLHVFDKVAQVTKLNGGNENLQNDDLDFDLISFYSYPRCRYDKLNIFEFQFNNSLYCES